MNEWPRYLETVGALKGVSAIVATHPLILILLYCAEIKTLK